jgi:DNA-directed RNA polymerase subunit beta
VYKDKDDKKDVVSVVGNDPALTSKAATVSDIVASFSYLVNLTEGVGRYDDIDHLGNRRVRCSGELIQNQFRIGIARIERVVKEKMSTADVESITPKKITNVRPLTAAIREFFASSQLSQFMDQMNPLSELANKRRLSALGPGGLSRDRAGFEVRDVHFSHYGRMCPIETPEGPNIGLINNLATYAKINEYGFIQTPYRKVEKTGKDFIVTDKTEYLTADEEYTKIIAQANIEIDESGKILSKEVVARTQGQNVTLPRSEINYVDVSPKQIVSIASACIPFLENDDAIRAAMGANMQRQAVPLLKPDAPYVGTGVEGVAAKYSGMALVATGSGTVEYVDSKQIIIKEKSEKVTYKLVKFSISNQGTVVNQSPIVTKGMKVKAGDIIADGPSMDGGELALGQNVTVAFMT